MPTYIGRVSVSGVRGEFEIIGTFDKAHEARRAIEMKLDELYPDNWEAFNERQYTRLDNAIAGPIALFDTIMSKEDEMRRRIKYLESAIADARQRIANAEDELQQLRGGGESEVTR